MAEAEPGWGWIREIPYNNELPLPRQIISTLFEVIYLVSETVFTLRLSEKTWPKTICHPLEQIRRKQHDNSCCSLSHCISPWASTFVLKQRTSLVWDPPRRFALFYFCFSSFFFFRMCYKNEFDCRIHLKVYIHLVFSHW